MNPHFQNNYIHSKGFDLLFILSPPFFCLLLLLLFPGFFQHQQEVNEVWWILLVLVIDVGHVYSSFFRIYFDTTFISTRKSLLYAVPLIGLAIGVCLYSLNYLLFWRCLAYLAVFHFIRQQYGFMRIYSVRQKQNKLQQGLDNLLIYAATIYPLLYWHLSGEKNFNWFIKDDFIFLELPYLLPFLKALYFCLLGIYSLKELYLYKKNSAFNLPKNLIVAGTCMSWYLGIVMFNGDLIFSLFNVVSHGLPYLALIWVYGKKEKVKANKSYVFDGVGILLFILVLIFFAFVEEGLWDVFVWDEHKSLFSWFSFLPNLNDSVWLNIIVPLLALPQITHYVLDGFVWKIKKNTVL